MYFGICFILDFVKDLTIKRMFRLSAKVLEIAFLQILNLSILSIYLYCKLKFYQFILLKILISLIIILLITDDYKFSKLATLFCVSNFLMFSYFGFARFFTILTNAIIIELFGIKTPYFCNFIIIFANICYIFAIFSIIKNLTKRKIINNFLKKVSFNAFGKHINLTGLIDTGNVLYDSKSKLPVVLVSTYSLEKYLPKNTYKNITNNNFKDIGVDHYLKLVTVSDKMFNIPVLKVKEVMIEEDGGYKVFNAAVGIVCHKFENQKKYDCLIHRDFV